MWERVVVEVWRGWNWFLGFEVMYNGELGMGIVF